MRVRRGRCPHRPVAHGANSPECYGNRNILPRGDVGIAPYGGTFFPIAKLQFFGLLRYADKHKTENVHKIAIFFFTDVL